MAGSYITVSEETFEEMVLKSEKPVVVDFWAAWCQPCRMMAPAFEALAEEYHDQMTFAKLDTETNEKLQADYGIQSLPTLLYFFKGEPLTGFIGYRSPAELKQQVESVLAEIASQTA